MTCSLRKDAAYLLTSRLILPLPFHPYFFFRGLLFRRSFSRDLLFRDLLFRDLLLRDLLLRDLLLRDLLFRSFFRTIIDVKQSSVNPLPERILWKERYGLMKNLNTRVRIRDC